MSWSTAISELNDSVGDYFGETVTYTTVAGSATTGVTAVVDYIEAEGQAFCDIPTATISSPEIGALITLGSDSTTFRVYDYGNVRRGYTECDIRSTDYWQTCMLQSYSGGAWSGSAQHYVFFPEPQAVEYLDGDTSNVEEIFNVRTQYHVSITEKKRFKVGSVFYYIQSVQPDQAERYMDIQLSKREF